MHSQSSHLQIQKKENFNDGVSDIKKKIPGETLGRRLTGMVCEKY